MEIIVAALTAQPAGSLSEDRRGNRKQAKIL